jgi:hypothetical protein
MKLTPLAIHASLRRLLALATSPIAKHRLPFALRAGLCCGIPVMIGWFAGDIKAGLLATIGAFLPYAGRRALSFHRTYARLSLSTTRVGWATPYLHYLADHYQE